MTKETKPSPSFPEKPEPQSPELFGEDWKEVSRYFNNKAKGLIDGLASHLQVPVQRSIEKLAANSEKIVRAQFLLKNQIHEATRRQLEQKIQGLEMAMILPISTIKQASILSDSLLDEVIPSFLHDVANVGAVALANVGPIAKVFATKLAEGVGRGLSESLTKRLENL